MKSLAVRLPYPVAELLNCFILQIGKSGIKKDRLDQFLDKMDNENYSRTSMFIPRMTICETLCISSSNRAIFPFLLSPPLCALPVYDPRTGQEIILTDEEIAMIKRIQVCYLLSIFCVIPIPATLNGPSFSLSMSSSPVNFPPLLATLTRILKTFSATRK